MRNNPARKATKRAIVEVSSSSGTTTSESDEDDDGKAARSSRHAVKAAPKRTRTSAARAAHLETMSSDELSSADVEADQEEDEDEEDPRQAKFQRQIDCWRKGLAAREAYYEVIEAVRPLVSPLSVPGEAFRHFSYSS